MSLSDDVLIFNLEIERGITFSVEMKQSCIFPLNIVRVYSIILDFFS